MYLLWPEARTFWPAIMAEVSKDGHASMHVQQIGANLGRADLCLCSCLTAGRFCTGLLSCDSETAEQEPLLRNVALHKMAVFRHLAIDLPCLRSGRLSGGKTAGARVQ